MIPVKKLETAHNHFNLAHANAKSNIIQNYAIQIVTSYAILKLKSHA